MSSQAQQFKEQGNQKFQEKSYKEAISLYSKAIATAGSEGAATYYGNRSAAWFMMGEYKECIKDCEMATSMDPTLLKCYQRAAKSYLHLGEFEKAYQQIQKALQLDPQNKESKDLLAQIDPLKNKMSKADDAFKRGKYTEARNIYQSLEKEVSASSILALKLAWTELKTENYSQALRDCLHIIKSDPQNPEAYYVRGLALYATENYDQAIKHFQEALRLDPDHVAGVQLKKVRALTKLMKAARDAVFVRNFEESVQYFTEAIDVDPENHQLVATLTSERAEAYLRLGKLDECIEDCNRVIKKYPHISKAYLTRSTAYKSQNKFEESLADIQAVVDMEPNNTVALERLQSAQFELRKAKRPDYYKLLGISAIASELEIKNAYKAKALEWHPDKHSESEQSRQEAEIIFKQIGEAYDVLHDPFKRELYDKGYDLEAIKEREEYNKRRQQHGH